MQQTPQKKIISDPLALDISLTSQYSMKKPSCQFNTELLLLAKEWIDRN
jgi:hypothetical protein